MKKLSMLLMGVLCSVGLVVTGCSAIGYTVGTGPIENKQFDYKDFNNVEITSAFQYEITQSGSYSVVVSTHENLMDKLDIIQSGKTLIVRLKPGNMGVSDTKVIITMPELNKLVVSGASKGSATGFKSANQLEILVSGASQLNMAVEAGQTQMDISGASGVNGNLKAQDTRLTVSGASHCEVNGFARAVNMEVSGASNVTSPDFQMQDTNINVSGASKATINTKGTLNLDVTGASTLNYRGNPILSKVNVNGASKINSQ